MPSVVIAALFTATIVGATSIFVRLGDYSIENLFMYFYLITYRVKIVLDDLHYYASMEDTAIRRGDPAFAFFSWVLWLAAAAVIGNPPAYYTFIGITFAVMIGWILIARKNVKERSDEQDRKETESAHSRWLVLNFVPAA